MALPSLKPQSTTNSPDYYIDWGNASSFFKKIFITSLMIFLAYYRQADSSNLKKEPFTKLMLELSKKKQKNSGILASLVGLFKKDMKNVNEDKTGETKDVNDVKDVDVLLTLDEIRQMRLIVKDHFQVLEGNKEVEISNLDKKSL